MTSWPLDIINAEEIYNIDSDNIEDYLIEQMNESLLEENIIVTDLDITTDLIVIESVVETTDSYLVETIIEIEPGENSFDLTVIETDDDGNETKTVYLVIIDELDEENIKASFTNSATGESFYYDSEEGIASLAFVIPIGIVMSKAALTALFHTGAMIIVGGSAYVVATQAKRSDKYNHFAAVRKNNDLYIGKGLSESAAVRRLKSSKDTWSVSSNQAKRIAGLANPNGQPLREVDRLNGQPRPGRYWHWHPHNRTPKAHAFYGTAVR
ncbi:MAG: SAR2788 family putative toxin [Bacillaceae bacterium]|nr:SAR2788 family putative toxin [Bacillaceae bacterium]